MKTPSNHPELYDSVKYSLIGLLSYSAVAGMKEPEGNDPKYYEKHAYNACVHKYDEDSGNLYWIKEMARVLNADINIWDEIPKQLTTWSPPYTKQYREDFLNGMNRFLRDFKAAQKAVWRHTHRSLRKYLDIDERNSN